MEGRLRWLFQNVQASVYAIAAQIGEGGMGQVYEATRSGHGLGQVMGVVVSSRATQSLILVS
jgi:hypothetical protein